MTWYVMEGMHDWSTLLKDQEGVLEANCTFAILPDPTEAVGVVQPSEGWLQSTCQGLDGMTAGIIRALPVWVTITGSIAVDVSAELWLNETRLLRRSRTMNPGTSSLHAVSWTLVPGQHTMTWYVMEGMHDWSTLLKDQEGVLEANCTFAILPSTYPGSGSGSSLQGSGRGSGSGSSPEPICETGEWPERPIGAWQHCSLPTDWKRLKPDGYAGNLRFGGLGTKITPDENFHTWVCHYSHDCARRLDSTASGFGSGSVSGFGDHAVTASECYFGCKEAGYGCGVGVGLLDHYYGCCRALSCMQTCMMRVSGVSYQSCVDKVYEVSIFQRRCKPM